MWIVEMLVVAVQLESPVIVALFGVLDGYDVALRKGAQSNARPAGEVLPEIDRPMPVRETFN